MDRENSSKQFYAYRYFLVDNGQMQVSDLLENSQPTKIHPIDRMIENCIRDKIITRMVDNKDYMLVSCESASCDVRIFKFGKDMPITRFGLSETGSDIVEKKESSYPFIYVIIDKTKQIILLEKKTTIYANATQSKNSFHKFVIEYLHNPGYTFSMDEISDIASFWDTVKEAERIYEMNLYLRSPNLFGGAFRTNELLEMLKKYTNNDEVDISLKNDSGSLNIDTEMEDPLNYVVNGGGKWKITYGRKGKKRKKTVSSASKVKLVEIDNFAEYSDQNISLFPLEDIYHKIEELNNALSSKGWNKKDKGKGK